jgi:hypothetical protein
MIKRNINFEEKIYQHSFSYLLTVHAEELEFNPFLDMDDHRIVEIAHHQSKFQIIKKNARIVLDKGGFIFSGILVEEQQDHYHNVKKIATFTQNNFIMPTVHLLTAKSRCRILEFTEEIFEIHEDENQLFFEVAENSKRQRDNDFINHRRTVKNNTNSMDKKYNDFDNTDALDFGGWKGKGKGCDPEDDIVSKVKDNLSKKLDLGGRSRFETAFDERSRQD